MFVGQAEPQNAPATQRHLQTVRSLSEFDGIS